MNKLWYQKSFFRNLVDMHISDIDENLLTSFDAYTYAKNLKHAGIQTAYVYASNCLGLCLYPSKFGYKHPITKQMDLFGDTISACKKQGMGVIGYLNSWSSAAYDHHPEWRILGADGKGSREQQNHNGRYGICCFNSGYRNYFLNLVEELCSSYQIDGLWVDMVGFYNATCTCESCQKQYYELTGKKIPTKIDWYNQEWVSYIRFKQKSMADYASQIRQTALKANQKLSVSIQCAAWSLGAYCGFSSNYFSQVDYSSGDFYGDILDQIVVSKFMRNISSNRPFEYMVSCGSDLIYHTMTKPLSQLKQQAYMALLQGASFLSIDAINPNGTMNESVYDKLHEVKESLSKFYDEDYYMGNFLCEVAIYINFESMINTSDNKQSADKMSRVSPIIPRLNIMTKSLSRKHILFDIITDKNIEDFSNYKVIILSNLEVLTAREQKVFEAFVTSGGILYVSGNTGTICEPDNPYDFSNTNTSNSLKNEDFALADLMGVHLDGDIQCNPIYLTGKNVNRLFSEQRITYPYMTAGPIPMVSIPASSNATVLADVTLPISSHDDPKCFSSAISDPPFINTNYPALVINTVGQGKCCYSACILEGDSQYEMSIFFAELVQELLGTDSAIKIDAPECIELSIRALDNNFYSISLLNTCAPQTNYSPINDIKIRLKLKDLPNGLVIGGNYGDSCVTHRQEGDIIEILIDNMQEFAVITLSPKL